MKWKYSCVGNSKFCSQHLCRLGLLFYLKIYSWNSSVDTRHRVLLTSSPCVLLFQDWRKFSVALSLADAAAIRRLSFQPCGCDFASSDLDTVLSLCPLRPFLCLHWTFILPLAQQPPPWTKSASLLVPVPGSLNACFPCYFAFSHAGNVETASCLRDVHIWEVKPDTHQEDTFKDVLEPADPWPLQRFACTRNLARWTESGISHIVVWCNVHCGHHCFLSGFCFSFVGLCGDQVCCQTALSTKTCPGPLCFATKLRKVVPMRFCMWFR